MGCDIHTYVEQQTEDGRWERLPNAERFDWRPFDWPGDSAQAWRAGADPCRALVRQLTGPGREVDLNQDA